MCRTYIQFGSQTYDCVINSYVEILLYVRPQEKIWKRVDVAKRRAPSPDVVLEPPADDVSLRRTGRYQSLKFAKRLKQIKS